MPTIELERKGSLLFIKSGNEQRVITFESKDASSTAKNLERALENMNINDKMTRSYTLSKLAELYQTITIESERGVYALSYESNGKLIEECYDGEKVYWLVYDSEKDEFSKVEGKLDIGDRIIFPVFNKDIETDQVLLPSDATEYGSNQALFNEARDFMDYWHEEPNANERKIDVLYAFLFHIYDIPRQEVHGYKMDLLESMSLGILDLGLSVLPCYEGDGNLLTLLICHTRPIRYDKGVGLDGYDLNR